MCLGATAPGRCGVDRDTLMSPDMKPDAGRAWQASRICRCGTRAHGPAFAPVMPERSPTMIRPLRAAALAALIAGPAGAQSPLDSIDGIDGAMGGPIGDAVEKLGEMAADQLLIRDFLGMELTDAEGKTVGTVRDFVAIPGGKLAGALVETSEGTRILVPWQLLSVESADGKAIRATQAAADLTGSQKLVDLASQLSD
ncbi:hypothetical protein CJ301_05400 [Limimaricola cinnabarinus]|uniref:PRC-barrel domain-containing protein n=2 Tax=Limimaricola cinnabarinus TaxID=1125964 RepID=A0A2G1MIW0_9RHOB|nr:hypothetical protein CJ301_05400 [Limimaricola cinnabarinus]